MALPEASFTSKMQTPSFLNGIDTLILVPAGNFSDALLEESIKMLSKVFEGVYRIIQFEIPSLAIPVNLKTLPTLNFKGNLLIPLFYLLSIK